MPDALARLGWNERWEALFEPHALEGLTAGRVIRGDRGSALVATRAGIVRAAASARLLKLARGTVDLPAVGDWVAVMDAEAIDVPLIEAVLPRAGAMTRGDPGEGSDVQVLAANVDTVFVVHPIAEPPNLRRIERELALAWDSGAVPVIALTKIDLSADPDGARAAVESIALGVDVLAMNALAGDGVAPLLDHLSGHRTGVLLGPSGAGKSTIANVLLGRHRQETQAVRVGDQRGRHTTVARELLPLPGGGVLIDTPGLRALGLTGSEEGISRTFSDVEQLAGGCRFRDCTHESEPGCAVRAAVDAGALPATRLDSYRKLLREADVAAARTDARLRAAEDRKAKTISKAARDYFRTHPR
ncbi:MAG: ribosome small subunit-dependent GTPase A [Solirubrobacteraceae bacterium]|nr:ribosome small subunit-dependent GTPase A [Solirubrobacteraceae bacterium]